MDFRTVHADKQKIKAVNSTEASFAENQDGEGSALVENSKQDLNAVIVVVVLSVKKDLSLVRITAEDIERSAVVPVVSVGNKPLDGGKVVHVSIISIGVNSHAIKQDQKIVFFVVRAGIDISNLGER